MTDAIESQIQREEQRLERQTDEGAQELRPRTRELVIAGGGMWPTDDLGDTMIINMGPQHPSTHGVLRLMMELDGEDVLQIKPVIGYLHTGMEKTGEELTYVQGTTNVTRMDYASNFANELVYSLAVERLLDVDGARTRHLDPHDDVRAVADGVAPVVPSDERHGHRRGVDDALRLARARRGVAHLRVRHRACG